MEAHLSDTDLELDRKAQAAAWFEDLRDRICAAFEGLEDAQASGPFAALPPGRFARKATSRAGGDGGGGVMTVMREGRLFEKVGVNVSTVYGTLDERAQRSLTARKEIAGLAADPRFWASGISLVAHMRSPRCPAVHMNTRMFWTPQAWWFGGGTDLNPMIEDAADTASFHRVLEAACDRHDPGYYPRFKAWADEYFLIRHWNEPRGVGGIFFDDLCTGDWEADFAFTLRGRAGISRRVPADHRAACRARPGPKPNARSSSSNVDATPSSTLSTTGAPASGSRPATIPRRC